MDRCKDYVGVRCIDGSCPIALHDEYEERGMDCIKSCEECFFIKAVKIVL